MARRASINGQAATIDILRHMGVTFIDRKSLTGGVALCHGPCPVPSVMACGRSSEGFDHFAAPQPFGISAGFQSGGHRLVRRFLGFRIVSGLIWQSVRPGMDDGVAIDVVDTGHDAFP